MEPATNQTHPNAFREEAEQKRRQADVLLTEANALEDQANALLEERGELHDGTEANVDDQVTEDNTDTKQKRGKR